MSRSEEISCREMFSVDNIQDKINPEIEDSKREMGCNGLCTTLITSAVTLSVQLTLVICEGSIPEHTYYAYRNPRVMESAGQVYQRTSEHNQKCIHRYSEV